MLNFRLLFIKFPTSTPLKDCLKLRFKMKAFFSHSQISLKVNISGYSIKNIDQNLSLSMLINVMLIKKTCTNEIFKMFWNVLDFFCTKKITFLFIGHSACRRCPINSYLSVRPSVRPFVTHLYIYIFF